MIGNRPKAPLGLTPEEIAALPPDGGPHYNRLVFENSPYLLQHAGNPVDWRPWGEESFEAARREGKPIFLSIGYATCHWCHVMERESFEDSDIARLLNSRFIPVKVDREERPDIDQVYMTVTQGLTGRGGWPMTVFLTPDGRPFFAGTYFPPVNRSGQVGMRELLPRLAEAWEHDREKVVASAEEITDWLRGAVKAAAGELDRPQVLRQAFEQLRDRYDPSHGGFGQRPKFPTPHNLTFLLRYWKRTGEPRALEMVTTTLSAMRRGGIFDHLGFGFHRYSTDREWLVPHFEKMLYDQALLAMAYLDAWQATGQEEWASVAREVFDYVLRDLVLPEGGFSSAEDADSEGEEGRFYLWTSEQVREVLGEGADVWLVRYGFRDEGNYLDEATGRRTGANIPHLLQATEGSVTGSVKQIGDRDSRLEQARMSLLEERAQRERPLCDDKVLADWNGLIIAALAMGARRLGDARLSDAADRAARFIWERMRDDGGRLLHRYRAGNAGLPGLLDDYAFLAWGMIELYQTTFEVIWLDRACELVTGMIERFADPDFGGFYMTPSDGEQLLVRSKEIYDGAVPSGNSVACSVLVRLARITGRLDWEDEAHRLVGAFGERIAAAPSAHTHLMSALDFLEGPSIEIVLAGDPDSDDLQAMLRTIRSSYVPNCVVLLRPEPQEDPAVAGPAPWVRDQRSVDGRATAYVCRDRACDLPINDADALREALQKPMPPR